MATSWTKTFFEVIRNFAPSILRLLERPAKSAPLSWDGTKIKDHLTPEDWQSLDSEFTEQLKQGNDRSVAIVGASMVEDRLRWLIETKFIDGLSGTKKERLFTGLGPLSSFSAKVEIAFALGLLKPELREQLQLIGQIRNRFAHNFRRVRFSDPQIAPLCDKLREFDKESLSLPRELRDFYGASCFLCMTALFVTGQLVLASRSGPPATSSD